jgi:two-component system phosphate regulon sensor histidine kinase PhoR
MAADRARMEAVLGGMFEGVLVVDRAGALQLVNPAARRMLRLPDAGTGRHYLEVVRHPEIAAQIGGALKGAPGARQEIALQPALVGVVQTSPVASEHASGAVVVLHDITDLRRADRVRRDFVANVSHELRTPLTAVRGYVEALLDGVPDEAEERRFLEVIARHTWRMERLVRDLLRLARLDARQESREDVPCSLRAALDGVEAELGAAIDMRRARVARDIAGDADVLRGDPAKLHDVLRNLVENAVNYSPDGGTVTVRAARRGERVVVTVADQGSGIPDADLTRVFERFYRVDKARSRGERDPGGTGLGLAIVKHLVELHGGRVTAANAPGGGAVFTLDLPSGASAAGDEAGG